MTIELIEEIKFNEGSMYAVKVDGQLVKWYCNKEEAERVYEAIKNDPKILERQINILKSDTIDVSLEH